MEGKRCLECIENKKEGTKMKEGKRKEEGNKQANSHLCQGRSIQPVLFSPFLI